MARLGSASEERICLRGDRAVEVLRFTYSAWGRSREPPVWIRLQWPCTKASAAITDVSYPATGNFRNVGGEMHRVGGTFVVFIPVWASYMFMQDCGSSFNFYIFVKLNKCFFFFFLMYYCPCFSLHVIRQHATFFFFFFLIWAWQIKCWIMLIMAGVFSGLTCMHLRTVNACSLT